MLALVAEKLLGCYPCPLCNPVLRTSRGTTLYLFRSTPTFLVKIQASSKVIMADSLSIAEYSTNSKNITNFSGHFTSYTRDNKNWFCMTGDKAYFNYFLVAQWNNESKVWQFIKLRAPKTTEGRKTSIQVQHIDRKVYTENKEFILRQLSLAQNFISNRKATILYKDESSLTGGAACKVLADIFKSLKLTDKISLGHEYLKLNPRFTPNHIFHYNNIGSITGVKLPQEYLVDMFLIVGGADKLNISHYFLPEVGQLSSKRSNKKK